MAENLLFTNREAKFLKELVKLRVEFMIVGLSAAALQGAPVVTQDIDLWFKDLKDPNLVKALRKMDGTFVPSFGENPPMFAGDNLEMFDIVLNVHGLGEFAEELDNTISIPLLGVSVPVLKLERIIASKKAANRHKDRLVLPVLEDALLAVENK